MSIFLDKLVLTNWKNVKLVLMKVLRKQTKGISLKTVTKMSNVLKNIQITLKKPGELARPHKLQVLYL